MPDGSAISGRLVDAFAAIWSRRSISRISFAVLVHGPAIARAEGALQARQLAA